MAGLLRLTNTKRDNRGIEADVEKKAGTECEAECDETCY
jgi:hypothetical protein